MEGETTVPAGFDTLIEGVPFGKRLVAKPLDVGPVPGETKPWAVFSSLPSSLESCGILSVALSLSLSLITFFAFLEGCWPICEE